MILKTKTIKEFLTESSVVKPSILFANLSDLIKIEAVPEHSCFVFTKTNNNVFCTLVVDDPSFMLDDECYIVGEKALNGLAQTTTSETITIKQNGELLNLTGHSKEIIKCPVIDVKEFPITPARTIQTVDVHEEALFCIKVAGNYVNKDQKITSASFVHIDDRGVFATNNNNIVYYRQFAGLPQFFLDQDALPVIKPIHGVTYATHGNYDFLNYPNGLSFGFIKSTFETPFNYMPMISTEGVECFTIMRANLLNFCTLVNYAAKTEYPVGVLKFDSKTVTLDHDDANFNIHVHKEYEVAEGPACDNFNFSVKWLETFLKPLPYVDLTFTRIGQHFKVTTHEDPEFTSIFAGSQS